MDSRYRFMEPVKIDRRTDFNSNFWAYYSVKRSSMVECFGNMAYYHLLCLEMSPEVRYFCERPFIASFRDRSSGKDIETCPNAWVLFQDGREEVQDVALGDAMADTAKAYIEGERAYCELHGLPLNVIGEKDIISSKMHLQNLDFLYQRVRRCWDKPDTEGMDKVEGLVRSAAKPFNVAEIADACGYDIQKSWDILAVLYYRGRIWLETVSDKTIRINTEVSPGGSKEVRVI